MWLASACGALRLGTLHCVGMLPTVQPLLFLGHTLYLGPTALFSCRDATAAPVLLDAAALSRMRCSWSA